MMKGFKLRFDKLISDLRDNNEEDFANALAITLYHADMWNKYQEENRISYSLQEALEATSETNACLAKEAILKQKKNLASAYEAMSDPQKEDFIDLEEMWDWCHDLDPEANAAKEFDAHKDASGATYAGYDEEDIPGQARKGEN